MKYKNLNNYTFPDKEGRFGEFGGKYVSETLITALEELEKVYVKVKKDKSFQQEVIKDLNDLFSIQYYCHFFSTVLKLYLSTLK